MADTSGTRYRGGCASRKRGGTTATRAVCTEVLSVVHGIAVGNPRAGNRTPRAEALAIGYGTPYGLLDIGRFAIGRLEGLLAIGMTGSDQRGSECAGTIPQRNAPIRGGRC